MYLSDPSSIDKALEVTGLALDELESVVGRFPSDHHNWPNQLKGELHLTRSEVRIRHHFTKKVLWRQAIDITNKDLFDI